MIRDEDSIDWQVTDISIKKLSDSLLRDSHDCKKKTTCLIFHLAIIQIKWLETVIDFCSVDRSESNEFHYLKKVYK